MTDDQKPEGAQPEPEKKELRHYRMKIDTLNLQAPGGQVGRVARLQPLPHWVTILWPGPEPTEWLQGIPPDTWTRYEVLAVPPGCTPEQVREALGDTPMEMLEQAESKGLPLVRAHLASHVGRPPNGWRPQEGEG